MVKYRILERRANENWTPFGVAYERDECIVLFAPSWRADKTLAAASLEELDERHCPSAEFRWSAVETMAEPVQHPIELLQRALDVYPGAETFAVMEMTVHTPQGEVPAKVFVGKGIEMSKKGVEVPMETYMGKGIVEAIRNLLSGTPSFAFARGSETRESAPAERGELPSLDSIMQDLQNDPELLVAFANLRSALADPQIRPNVLAALKAFARAASPGNEATALTH